MTKPVRIVFGPHSVSPVHIYDGEGRDLAKTMRIKSIRASVDISGFAQATIELDQVVIEAVVPPNHVVRIEGHLDETDGS